MSWEEWLVINKQKIKHVADYEEQFVRNILMEIPDIKPNDVIAQYHFRDSSGGNRYIDFMIVNPDKGYMLPIELDGFWKVQTYREFDDMLKRQNALVNKYGVLLRYTNKKMQNDARSIISEITHTLHLQNTNQLSAKDSKQKSIERLNEYQEQLQCYEEQLNTQKEREKQQAEKFKTEQAKRTKAEREAIKAKEALDRSSDETITKEDIATLQATIKTLQDKVEQGNNKPIPTPPPIIEKVDTVSGTKPTANTVMNNKVQPESPKTKLTMNHIVAMGAVSLIIVALGANAFFNKTIVPSTTLNNLVANNCKITSPTPTYSYQS